MGARAIAVMAMIGGVGWMIWPIPQALVGREWPAGAAVSWLLFLSVVGGTWVLAGATFGLITEFQDRIRTWTAALGSLGAVLGAFSVLGLFGAIVALPIGSAVLVWDLGRAGVLGRRLSRAHVAGAIIALTVIAVMFLRPALYDDRATAVPLMSLFFLYAFSWIAVGWSLRHGAPMPVPEPQRPRR